MPPPIVRNHHSPVTTQLALIMFDAEPQSNKTDDLVDFTSHSGTNLTSVISEAENSRALDSLNA